MKYRMHRNASQAEVTLSTRSGKTTARISDINALGARLDFRPGPVDLYGPVSVDFHGESYPARVVWIHRNQIGLRFAKELLPFQCAAFSKKRQRNMKPGMSSDRPIGRARRNTNPILLNRTL